MSLLYAVIYIAVLGILSHFVGQALPRARFSAESFPYRTADWENGVLTLDREKKFETPELTAEIMERLARYCLLYTSPSPRD